MKDRRKMEKQQAEDRIMTMMMKEQEKEEESRRHRMNEAWIDEVKGNKLNDSRP